MTNIKIKKLSEDAILPSQGNPGDAGWDISAVSECRIPPYSVGMVHTGLAVELPEGYELQVRGRSGLGKKGIGIAQGIGTIDQGYRGEICVLLQNHTPTTFFALKGERIGQLILKRVEPVEWEETSELNDSVRGEGGFGSTGK